LFGIGEEYDVACVDRIDSVQVKIIIEMGSRDWPCPGVWAAQPSGKAAAGQNPRFARLWPACELWRRKRRPDQWRGVVSAGFVHKRVDCGYRSMITYERHILTHIAVTRHQQHERDGAPHKFEEPLGPAKLGRSGVTAVPSCSIPRDDSAAVEELLERTQRGLRSLEGDDLLGVLRDVGPPHPIGEIGSAAMDDDA
jgi:hypothetical protein